MTAAVKSGSCTGPSILWFLILGVVALIFGGPGLLSGMVALDPSSIGSTTESSASVAETADEILIGGQLVKVAAYHPEAEEVFSFAKETFGKLPPEDLMLRASHQFRNQGFEAILLAVRHPALGWSGVFIRSWLKTGNCTVPTVFAFSTDGYLQFVIQRDKYIHSVDLLAACGGFPPAPKFR